MRRLIDWHTHCFLPEHGSAADAELQRRRGVLGTGEANPDQHRAVIEEAGIEQFVVVAIPRREEIHNPHDFIAEHTLAEPDSR